MGKGFLAALALAVAWFMAAAGPAPADDAPAVIAGKWRMVWSPHQMQGPPMHIVLQIDQSGAILSGKATIILDADKDPPANQDSHPVAGSVDGKTLSFSIPPHYENPDLKIAFHGRIEGDQMGGTTEQGDAWSASRVRK